MPYNYASAFKEPHYCEACLRRIQLAAIITYKRQFPEEASVLCTMHTKTKTVEVAGKSIVFYTWAELGFKDPC